ncbi:Uncharacterised protein [Mycobacteroides abscessus subsp. abscessus]|nr:Uncharacterised protein [Mycobacteroides abscessus subsp. abscessus]
MNRRMEVRKTGLARGLSGPEYAGPRALCPSV